MENLGDSSQGTGSEGQSWDLNVDGPGSKAHSHPEPLDRVLAGAGMAHFSC